MAFHFGKWQRKTPTRAVRHTRQHFVCFLNLKLKNTLNQILTEGSGDITTQLRGF